MNFTIQTLDHLLALYGYWAVLLFVAIESTGIPFPGETMLLAAAIYAGSTHHLNIWLVILAAAAGAIIGDNLGYMVGREGGYRVLRRYGRYIWVRERELKLGEYLFLRHGGKVVFFGRFVSILRTYAAFLAGVNRMPYPAFFFFNAAGGILWACLYGFGGYLLGKSVNRIAGPVGIVLGIIAALLIITFLIFLKRNFNRLADEAERALPGPLDERYRDAMPPDASTKRDGAETHASAPQHKHEDTDGRGDDGEDEKRPGHASEDTPAPAPR